MLFKFSLVASGGQQCKESWMRGFCMKSCGTCNATVSAPTPPGVPAPPVGSGPTPVPSVPGGTGTCTDKEPPGGYSCQVQGIVWGKVRLHQLFDSGNSTFKPCGFFSFVTPPPARNARARARARTNTLTQASGHRHRHTCKKHAGEPPTRHAHLSDVGE